MCGCWKWEDDKCVDSGDGKMINVWIVEMGK